MSILSHVLWLVPLVTISSIVTIHLSLQMWQIVIQKILDHILGLFEVLELTKRVQHVEPRLNLIELRTLPELLIELLPESLVIL